MPHGMCVKVDEEEDFGRLLVGNVNRLASKSGAVGAIHCTAIVVETGVSFSATEKQRLRFSF